MAKNDYYTMYDRGDHFFCQKVDPDDRTPITNVENASLQPGYKINKVGNGQTPSLCECFAGSKWCRHKAMLVEFQRHNRVNQRWLYSFDKKKWLAPLKVEE